MYLKSIEVHGFKSFANKILFEFHNGITGIVGPNGSGKSNVADAVRWVLGEQRAKQLRGSNMQDIIFSGTETRKALSYAYVAITLDNADRQLNLDFSEVTIARRVYRSGESEYLMNGTICRLRDVNELFYDTGIGKEGYSIIGQGQIEKIIGGKPEERRELFDETVGIVKFKRRKATTLKKLEDERQNLLRVNDILSELFKQMGPLEQQSEKAKRYLKKKEELKIYDVRMFLMEVERILNERKIIEEHTAIVQQDLTMSNLSYERMKQKYEDTETQIEKAGTNIEQLRKEAGTAGLEKGKLEGQMNILHEQISAAAQRQAQFQGRKRAIEKDKEVYQGQKSAYQEERNAMKEQLLALKQQHDEVMVRSEKIQEEIKQYSNEMEAGKNEVIELLNEKASTKAQQQRYDTMLEQAAIRKAQLNQIILKRSSEKLQLQVAAKESERELTQAEEEIKNLGEKEIELEDKRKIWQTKQEETKNALELETIKYHKEKSRLDSLRNIAERYDGFGNSIRRVMEQKEKQPGILGVTADLIKVEKRYETAIETALGSSIQNIVTIDETTAKSMIEFLKAHKYGRATFLPLTSVGKKTVSINEKAVQEPGVIEMANQLVKADPKYDGLLRHLLGKTYIVDTVENAMVLAQKFQHTLRIVTLEGELFSPGGSITGGAFKNSSNLLGRKREIEDLKKSVFQLDTEIQKKRQHLEAIYTARALLKDELEVVRDKVQHAMLVQNTAKLNAERAIEQTQENDNQFLDLQRETKEIETQMQEIKGHKESILNEILKAEERQKVIEEENLNLQNLLEKKKDLAKEVQDEVSSKDLEEANTRQKEEFIAENISRIGAEIAKLVDEETTLQQEETEILEDTKAKRQGIEQMKEQIRALETMQADLEKKLLDMQNTRDEMSVKYKGFFKEREDLSEKINRLDKELFRLDTQKEKLDESEENQNNYMWEEYELTYHNARNLRDSFRGNPDHAADQDKMVGSDTNSGNDQIAGNDNLGSLPKMKQQIAAIKDEIRKLGDVNVNAIEEYKSLFERYTFLKEQQDDLVTAEKILLGLIEELDTGMRKQFLEKFHAIQCEFDKAFKELFGGGKGSLELVEDEDILECGIRIIAQPPGKKLQNMMQLSGGEKALTAISLLFAIQNLKPSPFCLLDEIEAALDDSNVGRFASYLHKLTKHTQFIMITHRRGTMEAADRLYGITMQEKGVSTLVSVNLIEEELDD
ncbi:chromosome segregation protein SMC [Lachnospiraceae bacterium ZAX-1]